MKKSLVEVGNFTLSQFCVPYYKQQEFFAKKLGIVPQQDRRRRYKCNEAKASIDVLGAIAEQKLNLRKTYMEKK